MAKSSSELAQGSGGYQGNVTTLAVVEHAVKLKLLADVDPWVINAAGG